MGSCFSVTNSETYIFKLLNAKCFLNFNRLDLEQMMVNHLKGEPDYVNKSNLELTKDIYHDKIAKDIYNIRYNDYRKESVSLKGEEFDHKAVEGFVFGLWGFIDINNTVNSLIFKLIMLPIILKKNDNFNDNVDVFYDYLKRVNFSSKNMPLIKEDMTYGQFSDTFSLYLAIVLSGWTKLIMDNLKNSENSDEMLMNDFQESLNVYFIPENINRYYSYLTCNMVKDLESRPGYSGLSNSKITRDDFKDLCEEFPCIVNYFELRENFREFVDKYNSNNIK